MSANDRNLVHYQRLPKEFLIVYQPMPTMTGKAVENNTDTFIRSAFEGRRPPAFFDITVCSRLMGTVNRNDSITSGFVSPSAPLTAEQHTSEREISIRQLTNGRITPNTRDRRFSDKGLQHLRQRGGSTRMQRRPDCGTFYSSQ